jgi:hypothetical protein
MELQLNYGEHILFGLTMTSLTGRSNRNYTVDETLEIADLVHDLCGHDFYETEECPDFQIMINPEDTYTIFCEWFDENETYFEEYFSVSN